MLDLDRYDFEVIPKLTAQGREKLLRWYASRMVGAGVGGWEPKDFEPMVISLALDRLGGADFFAPVMERLAATFSIQAEELVSTRTAGA